MIGLVVRFGLNGDSIFAIAVKYLARNSYTSNKFLSVKHLLSFKHTKSMYVYKIATKFAAFVEEFFFIFIQRDG